MLKLESDDFECELNDDELGSVSGGIIVSPTDCENFLCPCDKCEMDTKWILLPDSEQCACTMCGTVKDIAWFSKNKIRKKGVNFI